MGAKRFSQPWVIALWECCHISVMILALKFHLGFVLPFIFSLFVLLSERFNLDLQALKFSFLFGSFYLYFTEVFLFWF